MEQIKDSKEDKLLTLYNNRVDSIPKLQVSLREGKTNERFLSITSWGFFESFALKYWFIDADQHAAKLCFYKCGLLDELLITKYDEKILDFGINHLSYALLSDNKELINRYANLRHSNYEQMIQNGTAAPLYTMQCLIKDDWTGFERAMKIVQTKTGPKFKMDLDAIFFEALANKDKTKAEQVLAEFLTPKMHKARNNAMGLIAEFVSQPALTYAKLAWLKGMEVMVNNPLVPQELLPIAPLPTYEEIDLFSITR